MPELVDAIDRYFWNTILRGGEVVARPQHVDALLSQLDAEAYGESAAQPPGLDETEKKALARYLDMPEWSAALSQPAKARIKQALGRPSSSSAPVISAPQPAAPVTIPKNFKSTKANLLFTDMYGHAPHVLGFELSQRTAELFDESIPRDLRVGRLLAILRDFGIMFGHAEKELDVRQLRHATLRKFVAAHPLAREVATADYDGDGLPNGMELLRGLDPLDAQHQLDPPASNWSEDVYIYMDDSFLPAIDKIDALLQSAGLPAGAGDIERRSIFATFLALEPGNSKSNWKFEEASAIHSTHYDLAKWLLPDQKVLGDRKLLPQFDIAADFLAAGSPLRAPKQGDQLLAYGMSADGQLTDEVLSVTPVLTNGFWFPEFRDASGAAVDPSEVVLGFVDRQGQPLGDGRATDTFHTTWFGYCMENALLQVVARTYGFPSPERAVKILLPDSDEPIEFSVDEIKYLLARTLPVVPLMSSDAGTPFQNKLDAVRLHPSAAQLANAGVMGPESEVLYGRIKSPVNWRHPDTAIDGGQLFIRTDEDRNAPRGTVLINAGIGGVQEVAVDDIEWVKEYEGTPKHRIVMSDGRTVTGTLNSPIDFSKVRPVDGVRSIAGSAVVGQVAIELLDGSIRRVSADRIELLTTEDKNALWMEDVVSHFLANRGIAAVEADSGPVVANVHRVYDRFESAPGTEPPSWAADIDLSAEIGRAGPVSDKDRVRFVRLQNSSFGSALWGWIEFDEDGVPVNSRMVSEALDGLSTPSGDANWHGSVEKNEAIPRELVLSLYLHSLSNPAEHEIKDGVHLWPDDWRDYLLPMQDGILQAPRPDGSPW